VKALPPSGGEVYLLPGLHQTNTVIRDGSMCASGCHTKTRVIPRRKFG
jgi:hypothetical protein